MDRNIYIENCEYTVEYECPYEWKNLKKIGDSKIRFCNECNKNVYRCKTEKDMDEHIKLNHCIAVNEPQVMGMIVEPKLTDINEGDNKVCKHCLEPPMYCTCIEEIIKENDLKK